MINEIKEFLKQNGLNWSGEISTALNQDFYKAKEEDFKDVDIIDFLITFDNQEYMAISIELDLAKFTILGESVACGFDKYAGNNLKNKKLCEERDLSQDWVKFQLRKNGLIYATTLRSYCEKNKNRIERSYEEKEKILNAKIKVLQSNKAKSLKVYEDLETQADSVENML